MEIITAMAAKDQHNLQYLDFGTKEALKPMNCLINRLPFING